MSTASKRKLWLWFNTAENCRCLEEHEQSPESWATYSERVVGRSGGGSSGPCWWRQHGKSCWKDAKCAEVQPRDQTGLLLGIKMEKELRGGDQRGPACLGQPPPLVWTAPVSPTQLTQAPWTSSSPCGRAGLSRPHPDVALLSKLLCCCECLHILTQPWGSSWGPRPPCQPLPLTFTPTLPSPAPLSPLDPPHTLSALQERLLRLYPRLATSYSSYGFHRSLDGPSSRNLLSSQRPQLRCPFWALLTHSCSPKTAGIT